MTPPAAGRILAALTEPIELPESPGACTLPTIDGYIIEDRLGSGAGGEVFRAVRLGSDRQLAVKLLRFQLGEGPQARRAWRELDLLQQLHLPCMPRLIDNGVHDGRLFIATEFIEGQALDEHCRLNELDLTARVELLARTADAVQSINEVGILHRDIKPSNIIVDAHGRPMLIDLGIATLLSGNNGETLTEEGSPIGSPAFMAPEQARGERDRISTRSDVYSLGATAYVLLTGSTPHDMEATLHETIRRVAQDEPRHPRELMPSLPRPLGAILARACARSPEDRYRTAAEFADDLRRWLRHDPVEAGGLSLPQRMGRVVGRHPVTTTAALCITIAFFAALAAWVSIWYSSFRAYEIRVTTDGREARLLTAGGRILHKWTTTAETAIKFARLVDCPDGLSQARMALIGYSQLAEPPHTGSLCAFAVDGDRDRLIWTAAIADADLPPDPLKSGFGCRQFGINLCDLADVFPDRPGSEIIAIFQHALSGATTIRIYDLEGELVYQIWHDGTLNSCYWLSDPRLLVLCGLNSEVPWQERGGPHTQPVEYPIVLFGVAPSAGHVTGGWAHPSSLGEEPTLKWYKCALPATFSCLMTDQNVRTPFSDEDPTCFLRLELEWSGHRGAQVSWLVDDTGCLVPNSFEPTDTFRFDETHPDASVFSLGDLPTVLSGDPVMETLPGDQR